MGTNGPFRLWLEGRCEPANGQGGRHCRHGLV